MLGGSIGMLGARVRTSELALARSETWRSGHACAIFVWASGHDAFNPDQFTNVKPGMLPSCAFPSLFPLRLTFLLNFLRFLSTHRA